jgi:hypothetical protein
VRTNAVMRGSLDGDFAFIRKALLRTRAPQVLEELAALDRIRRGWEQATRERNYYLRVLDHLANAYTFYRPFRVQKMRSAAEKGMRGEWGYGLKREGLGGVLASTWRR